MTAGLLVVDVQRDFLSPSLGVLGDGYEGRVAGLLDVVRRAGMPVVHVHSLFEPDGSDWMPRYRQRGSIPCVRGTPGAEVVPGALPIPGEPVIVKHTFDAFVGTDLQERLEALSITRLLVAGLVTGTCVLLSSAAAMQRGFEVAVVEDAVADVPAVHGTVLDGYRFIFDRVATAEALAWAQIAG